MKFTKRDKQFTEFEKVARKVLRLPEYTALWAVKGETDTEFAFKVWQAQSADLAAANAKGDKWRLALESLTAQGSEFHNDIDRCVAYVRERYAEGHKAKGDRVKMQRDLAAANEALKIARKTLDWYGEKATAVRTAMETKTTTVMEALLVELSLDAGRRAGQTLAKIDAIVGGENEK